MLGDCVVIV